MHDDMTREPHAAIRHAVDVLSGKRLDWARPNGVAFECTEGLFVTAEKESVPDRAWMGSCPPSGSMWKRIRMS